MAEKVTAVIDGVATEISIVSIVSEHKSRAGCPRGMKRVMAVIRAGRRGKPQTRHINVPR